MVSHYGPGERRAFGVLLGGPSPTIRHGHVPPQEIPVNVYETSDDLVIIAPMPGVEASDIDIEVVGREVRMRAAVRGEGQFDRQYLLHEWTYGPYQRNLTLPFDVDAGSANASHSNGILVLSLPKSAGDGTVRIPIRRVDGRGEYQGHSGHHTTREGLED